MAVDAGATVPAAVGLQAVVDAHHHLVQPLVLIQEWCDIDGERRVAIGMLSCLLTVDEDRGTLVDALEVEAHQLTLWRGKLLAILAHPAGIPAAAGARGSVLGVRSSVDVPVVGQVDTDGLAVLGEHPVIVEQLALLLCQQSARGGQSRRKENTTCVHGVSKK